MDKYLRGAPRVHLIDPLPADEMHNLMARSYLVLTVFILLIPSVIWLLNKALEGLELLFDRATGGKYAA